MRKNNEQRIKFIAKETSGDIMAQLVIFTALNNYVEALENLYDKDKPKDWPNLINWSAYISACKRVKKTLEDSGK